MKSTTLGQLVNDIAEVRADLRSQNASKQAIAEATENLVRDRWPFERAWKYLCNGCDDTGLMLTYGVTDRLGSVVDVGRPCTCSNGNKFRKPVASEADYVQAGKTPKQKPMTRFGGGR